MSVRPSQAARDHLARALAGMRTGDPSRWHVTLAFLGEVDDPAPLLPGLAAAAAGVPALSLRLSGGGSFRRSGVTWAGVTGDVRGLATLAGRVATACRDAGVALEDRPYRPHLTVGRRQTLDPGLLTAYDGPAWTATEVELVRSTLGRAVRHDVLEAFPLSG